jgi:hypothetical protein
VEALAAPEAVLDVEPLEPVLAEGQDGLSVEARIAGRIDLALLEAEAAVKGNEGSSESWG